MTFNDLITHVDQSFVRGVFVGIAVGVPVTVISGIILYFLKGFRAYLLYVIKTLCQNIRKIVKRLLVGNRRHEGKLANPENVDVQKVWSYSKRTILRVLVEELGYEYFSNREFYEVVKKLRELVGIPISRFPNDVIFPLVIEKALDGIIVFMETEPSGLVIIKLIVPRVFRVPRSGSPRNRLRMVCKSVMQRFINGQFELVLEDRDTYMLRMYLQQNWLQEDDV